MDPPFPLPSPFPGPCPSHNSLHYHYYYYNYNNYHVFLYYYHRRRRRHHHHGTDSLTEMSAVMMRQTDRDRQTGKGSKQGGGKGGDRDKGGAGKKLEWRSVTPAVKASLFTLTTTNGKKEWVNAGVCAFHLLASVRAVLHFHHRKH